MRRRVAGAWLILAAAAGGLCHAQQVSKPVHLVVGGPPGGGPDNVARILSQYLKAGPSVIVENKNGAAQMLATDYVLRAPADGSVLLLTSQTGIAISPVLQKSKTVPINELVPVGFIGAAPMILVAGPRTSINSVQDLIAHAKARPTEVNFGNGGPGTTPHMTGVLFAQTTGTQLTSVPYPGEQAAMVDIMAGRIDIMFANAPSALPHIRSGKLRALAVTSLKRMAVAPEIPTVAESGVPGFLSETWYGIVAPPRTPVATVTALNAEINRVLALPEVREKLSSHSFVVEPMTPEKFGQLMQAEHAKWGKLIRDARITID